MALLVGAVVIGAFVLAFKYSGWGITMRAQAENREAAALMGIRSSRVTAPAWLMAGLLAGIAVVFIATQDFSGVGLSRSTQPRSGSSPAAAPLPGRRRYLVPPTASWRGSAAAPGSTSDNASTAPRAPGTSSSASRCSPTCSPVVRCAAERAAPGAPCAGVDVGYAEGMGWQAFLEKACERGDMTRAGLHQAVLETTSTSTEDLVAELDFSNPGTPATPSVYVAQPDAVAEGGITSVKPLFEAPEAADYVAPHQKK